MHGTMINILKILHQTEITKENLAHNLDVKEGSLLKSINLINNFLKDLKIKEVQIEKGLIRLKLKKSEWCKIFKEINTLTFEEKVDYLYIKLIYYGFINLEKEREDLDISRSSINRCFLEVKKILEKNNSKFIYEAGRGTKVVELHKDNKNIFLLKLTKMILEEEILTPIQKELLNSIKKFNIKIRLTKLVAIYKCLKLPLTPALLSFLCALDIHSKYFQNEKYSFKNFKDSQMLKRIKCVINAIGNIDFSEEYKQILLYNICLISSNGHYFFQDILLKASNISIQLLEKLKIEDKKLKPILLQQLYFSILRKDFGILKIRNVSLSSEDDLILEVVDEILKKNSQKLNICDKYFIISILKEKIITNQITNINNVLVLVGEVNTLRQNELKKDLEINFPKIKFNIDYNYLNVNKTMCKSHDIVIDDFQSTLRDGSIFYRIKKSLEEELIKKLVRTI